MSFETGTIKVAIIEDQSEIRDGLGYLLNSTAGCACTGGFGSVEEALQGIGHKLPDVVLLDIGLPGIDGIEGARLLKERWPNLVIVTLTIYDDDERVFAALCAGASGYLSRTLRLRG